MSDCDGAPMYEYVFINNVKVCMEIDTDMYATVNSEFYYNKYFTNYQIVKTGRKLKTHNE